MMPALYDVQSGDIIEVTANEEVGTGGEQPGDDKGCSELDHPQSVVEEGLGEMQAKGIEMVRNMYGKQKLDKGHEHQ